MARTVLRIVCAVGAITVGPSLVNAQEGTARARFGGVDLDRGGQLRATDSLVPSAVQAEVNDSRAPVASLGALASHLTPSDKIYVRTMSGEEIAGRFSRASDASLRLELDGQTREIPAIDVQQVWRRGGNRVKRGMWVGFIAGAAIADIGLVASRDAESEYSVWDTLFLGTIAGGGAGLIWGAVIGAFVHERPIVYRAAAPTVRVMPAFAPGRAGAVLAVRF